MITISSLPASDDGLQIPYWLPVALKNLQVRLMMLLKPEGVALCTYPFVLSYNYYFFRVLICCVQSTSSVPRQSLIPGRHSCILGKQVSSLLKARWLSMKWFSLWVVYVAMCWYPPRNYGFRIVCLWMLIQSLQRHREYVLLNIFSILQVSTSVLSWVLLLLSLSLRVAQLSSLLLPKPHYCHNKI